MKQDVQQRKAYAMQRTSVAIAPLPKEPRVRNFGRKPPCSVTHISEPKSLYNSHVSAGPARTGGHGAKSASQAEALAVTELRYRRLFETARDGILLLNAETGRIEDVNQSLTELLGYKHAEFIGKKPWEMVPFKGTEVDESTFSELRTKRYLRFGQVGLHTEGGQSISVEFVGHAYGCNGHDIIEYNFREGMEPNVSQMAANSASRALEMLSQCSQAMLRERDEQGLLQEYCRIAVETGGYLMAWVGAADREPEKRVNVVAHFGCSDNYLETADIRWDESERGQGPTGRAIRTGQLQFTEDMSLDPKLSPWREEALKRRYWSSIALPFLIDDATRKCLTVYADKPMHWSLQERQVLQNIANDMGFSVTAIRNAMAHQVGRAKLQVSLEQTVHVIANTIGERDSYTAGHQRRVANLCSRIALELGLPSDTIHGLHLAASIHDLGKIGVPAEILAKPRALSAIEFALIKEHVGIGFNLLKNIDFPWPIARIIQEHHERMDGSGYPAGLKGDALLLESRILAVADNVEAMASHRPYRPALGIEVALAEITKHRGLTFDADVVDACVRIFRDHGYVIEDH